MKEYSNSKLQLVLNHQIKGEADQKIVVKIHFPSPETNVDVQQYFQQDKVFQSCLSSPMNDVVVQILSGLDMDKDSETTSMETSSGEQTNYIEFQERNKTTYAIFNQKYKKIMKRRWFCLIHLKIMVLKMHPWELWTVK